jgi:hypothetical protein
MVTDGNSFTVAKSPFDVSKHKVALFEDSPELKPPGSRPGTAMSGIYSRATTS